VTETPERERCVKTHHSISCRRELAVTSSRTKTQDTTTPVLDHPALAIGRPTAIGVHRRTATSHIVRRLFLILAITADTPAKDVADGESHWRGRHHRHLAKTLDFLTELVKGSRRVGRHAHGTSEHQEDVLEEIAMGAADRFAQRLRLAMPRQGTCGRPDAMRHSLPVSSTAGSLARQRDLRLKGLDRREHVLYLRKLMSSGRRGEARLAHRRQRATSAGRSGRMGRPNGRTLPATDNSPLPCAAAAGQAPSSSVPAPPAERDAKPQYG